MAEAQAWQAVRQETSPLLEVDTATLTLCAAGDEASLRSFVSTYEPVVFAYLSRALGHGPNVEDLAQDVFLKALRAIGRFDPRGTARCSTWLLTIAARVVLDFRKKRREAPLADSAVDGPPDPATPETLHRRGEIGAALAHAAGSLPDEQRDAFILAEFHDLTMTEMAGIARVPVGTFKARLSRARQRLRELLGDLWQEER